MRGAEDLYRRWGDDIWAYVRSMCGSDSDADDVFQQVFLKAHRGIARFSGSDAKARSWLFTIAINAVRDHHRRRRPQAVLDEASGHRAPGHGPLAQLEGQELEDLMIAAIDGLSPKLREVWVLRAERDMSFQEIADVLGEPRRRVMGRMYLALQQVREIYERSLPHD